LIAAQDLFFTLTTARNALELINYTKDKIERGLPSGKQPKLVTIASRSFVRFDYVSPVGRSLRWHRPWGVGNAHNPLPYVHRLHQPDTKLVEKSHPGNEQDELARGGGAPFRGDGGDFPVCVKDYASSENVMERVDPIFTERRFNPFPVRIIINQKAR